MNDEMFPDAEEATKTREETKSRKWDGELLCMAAILRSLDELEEPARARVVAWIHSRECERAKP